MQGHGLSLALTGRLAERKHERHTLQLAARQALDLQRASQPSRERSQSRRRYEQLEMTHVEVKELVHRHRTHHFG